MTTDAIEFGTTAHGMFECVSRLRDVPVRFSWLSRFESSPAHALHAAVTGFESTAAMKLGIYAHAMTFEPHRIVVYRPGIFTDKKGKTRPHSDRKDGEAWEQFRAAQADDAVIVNEREHAIATAIAESLRRADAERVDPLTGAPLPLLFGPGVELEKNIRWTRHGRACSSTPDARKPGHWVTDLKCARSAKPDKFMRAATWAGYPSQLTFYQEADAEDLGLAIPTARLFSVVVEPFPPYVVTTFELDAYAIEAGRAKVAEWWNRLLDCEVTDAWPGYASSVVTFTADDPETASGPLGSFEPDDAVNGNAVASGADDDHIEWSA